MSRPGSFLHHNRYNMILNICCSLLLLAVTHCQAATFIESSCGPYRAEMNHAVSEAGSIAKKAYQKLDLSFDNNVKVSGIFQVLFGKGKKPTDKIGLCRPASKTFELLADSSLRSQAVDSLDAVIDARLCMETWELSPA